MTDTSPTPLELAAVLAAILDDLGIPYVVGGAVASTILGEPRATEDLDLVAAITPANVDAFLSRLEADFYVPTAQARDAVARQASFNVIHGASVRKIDIFVARDDALGREEMARRQLVTISTDPLVRLFIATAEDIILQKLLWFEKGHRVSDRQWRDVLGVLKVQQSLLDRAYLDRWAVQLRVSELLSRAYHEAGLP